jgi:hypothetical protein
MNISIVAGVSLHVYVVTDISKQSIPSGPGFSPQTNIICFKKGQVKMITPWREAY